MAEIDLTPTEEMAANAARGLELRRKHGKGGTAIGVARARDISNRKNLSPDTVKRMHSYFSRHEVDKKGEGWGKDSAGYIAWLLWGGDAGQSWAKRKVEQMNKGENQRSDTYKEIAQRLGSAAKMAHPDDPFYVGTHRFKVGDVVKTDTIVPRYGKIVRLTRATNGEPAYVVDDLGLDAKPKQSLGRPQWGDGLLVRASRPGAKAKMGFVGTAGRAGAMAARGMQDGAAAYRAGKPAVLNRLDPKYHNWSDKDLEVYGKFWMRGWTGEQIKDMTARDPKRGTDLPGSRFFRPGAKAKFGMTNAGYKALVDAIRQYGNSAPAAVVAQAKQMKQEPTEFTDNEVMAVIAKMKQARASRPGAKAKMATEGRVKVDGVEYRVLPYQVEYFKSDLAKFDDPKWRKQVVQQYLAKNYIVRASRPGAKAKFAVSPEVTASLKFHTSKMNDLLRQFRSMSRKAFGDRFDPAWLAEHAAEIEAGMSALNAGRIKEATSRMRAWADEFTSTYLQHAHTRDLAMLARAIAREPAHVMEVAQASGVRMSRLGAKAKMEMPSAKSLAINEKIAALLDKGVPIREAVERVMGPGSWETVGGAIYDALRKKRGMSRPGAKAKFAVKVGDRVHAGVGTAGGAGVIGTVTKIEDGYAHIQADASASDRYGAKTYKAPLRLVTAAPKKAWESSKNAVREGEKVSASDDAVSRKIRKLMDEGKPQKQAVAIALDLERRGEL